MTPYSVMPCHVRLSSPLMPGPVFCCASAGAAAVTALIKASAQHASRKSRLTKVVSIWYPRLLDVAIVTAVSGDDCQRPAVMRSVAPAVTQR